MKHVTYSLTECEDSTAIRHGWTHEITVHVDGVDEHSKLYRSLATAREALAQRADAARSGGRCASVMAQDATL